MLIKKTLTTVALLASLLGASAAFAHAHLKSAVRPPARRDLHRLLPRPLLPRLPVLSLFLTDLLSLSPLFLSHPSCRTGRIVSFSHF